MLTPARAVFRRDVSAHSRTTGLTVSLTDFGSHRRQVRYLDLPDRQDLRKLQQLREEQGELSAADERRLKTLLVTRGFYRRARCSPVSAKQRVLSLLPCMVDESRTGTVVGRSSSLSSTPLAHCRPRLLRDSFGVLLRPARSPTTAKACGGHQAAL